MIWSINFHQHDLSGDHSKVTHPISKCFLIKVSILIIKQLVNPQKLNLAGNYALKPTARCLLTILKKLAFFKHLLLVPLSLIQS